MFFVVDMERELEMHPRFFHKNLVEAQNAQISKEVSCVQRRATRNSA